MATDKQADRPLTVDTPLGTDKMLLRGLKGREAISQLFRFELNLLADNKLDVKFDQLLGKKVTAHVPLAASGKRHFNGVCLRLTQAERDPRETMFTAYRMEIVPTFWFWTRRAQSRIFQHKSVPDILKEVLKGLNVSFDLQGVFHPRDYCVQYRETDFNFATRLMEEEGIFYFFKHTESDHSMVVSNSSGSHSDLPGPSTLIYENAMDGKRDEDRVLEWSKTQELRSGKYTLWDHSFEIPHKNLEAKKESLESVSVGSVTHKLKLPETAPLEIYDFPGEYAQRFDGVNASGGDQPADLQKIFEDNKRTVEIRMQEETLPGLKIRGSSNVRQMVAGHKFKLQRHFNADGGPYVLTELSHDVSGSGEFRPGATGAFEYRNEFTCIPVALPFRPPRSTQKPVVPGSQTAVVVGPPGEEIFPDKYGRVKVQFHWDREGKHDNNSSCWIRVASHWAGKQWGSIHIPRVGQEVVVDFLEGDPDQPIIVGSVYNADMMPPYALPANKTQSGIKSRSSTGGGPENFNELRFEDKKGKEQIFLHAERNQDIEVEADETHSVGNDRTKTIGNDEKDKIKGDWKVDVDGNRVTTVGGSRSVKIGGSDTENVGGSQTVVADGISMDSGAGHIDMKSSSAIFLSGGSCVAIGADLVTISSSSGILLRSSFIQLDAAVVSVSGVLMATALMATDSVASPSYTPGVGNIT